MGRLERARGKGGEEKTEERGRKRKAGRENQYAGE